MGSNAKSVPTDLLSHSKMVAVLKSKGQKFDTQFLKADFQRNELEQIFIGPRSFLAKNSSRSRPSPDPFKWILHSCLNPGGTEMAECFDCS